MDTIGTENRIRTLVLWQKNNKLKEEMRFVRTINHDLLLNIIEEKMYYKPNFLYG